MMCFKGQNTGGNALGRHAWILPTTGLALFVQKTHSRVPRADKVQTNVL